MNTWDIGPSVEFDFVRRLVDAQTTRSVSLAAARRWVPGAGETDVAALIGSVPAEQSDCYALTSHLFALWHHRRSSASRGFPGQGVGRWAHQLGVKDYRAHSVMTRIIAAEELDDLTTALGALASMRTRRAPHWETVLHELIGWTRPARRADVRFDWARDFYRYVPPRAAVVAGSGLTAQRGAQ